MNIALVDLPDQRIKLYPLTMTRPIGCLRVGMMTIQEKWTYHLPNEPDLLSSVELNAKYQKRSANYDLVINAGICPQEEIVRTVLSLREGEAMFSNRGFVAAKGNFKAVEELLDLSNFSRRECEDEYVLIERTWDIFMKNAEQLVLDYYRMTKDSTSHAISDKHSALYGEENIFLEEGVKIKAACLNAENGPIYLSKHSEVQEGVVIRGPFFLGEGSRINSNAQIKEGTTIGPGCKVGGEVSNSVIYGYSNKAHEGFLGNSVIGEFCNLGAATNNSNLKNNYGEVKMWDYQCDTFIGTNLQFCGLIMGDHSKSAIGTTFNTGTTVGVSCNIFGSGFPRTIISSFSWGGAQKSVTYDFDKAVATATRVLDRRSIKLSAEDIDILRYIFESSQPNDI